MNPKKLKAGDEIRVIAPARSMSIISDECQKFTNQTLEKLGLKITFGRHVAESDLFLSSSIESRIDDLHQAFADPSVKGILSVIGGYNSNQLLPFIDYDLIAKNPKVFCGFSDITALQNSLLAKSGLVTYSGPHYSTFGMKRGLEYTLEYFAKVLFSEEPVELFPSPTWSNDAWYLDQEHRHFENNTGPKVIYPGSARGTIVGGNLTTLLMLQGTSYMPSLEDALLFIEDDEETGVRDVGFDRALQALTLSPGFSGVRGILIGRFERGSDMSDEKMKAIIHSKPILSRLPIVYNVDFGHTTPCFTFPIGGIASLEAIDSKVKIILEKH